MRLHTYKMTATGAIASINMLVLIASLNYSGWYLSQVAASICIMPLALIVGPPGPARVGPNSSLALHIVSQVAVVPNAYLWGLAGAWLIRRSKRPGNNNTADD